MLLWALLFGQDIESESISSTRLGHPRNHFVNHTVLIFKQLQFYFIWMCLAAVRSLTHLEHLMDLFEIFLGLFYHFNTMYFFLLYWGLLEMPWGVARPGVIFPQEIQGQVRFLRVRCLMAFECHKCCYIFPAVTSGVQCCSAFHRGSVICIGSALSRDQPSSETL